MMNTADDVIVPRTIPALWQAKRRKQPITMLTAYDASFARAADEAGIDVLLVGDSLGMVVQGQRDTLSVTLDDMVYHTQLVRRGAPGRLIMADMPFLSDSTVAQALASAGRLLQEGGADLVKIEGGEAKAPIIRALTDAGIPVCAHVGLLPQHVRQLGGYRVQGRDAEDAARILHDAEVLVEAGAVMVLVECVPGPLGTRLATALETPVIGIGAGNGVDGQVLVLHDLLGLNDHPPRFVRDFLRGRGSIGQALTAYVAAVRDRSFPAEHEGYI
ncbi:3-methyl-2-oxobutanoate hydroxymethyltransferase [Halothiobacillus diazotrophicus]|uniref:3-methyl-2-oxobutanoate hydroxymethyltransferase n=1 Tax=Halothiobacillus diazotrophicus TaxID=1860122 RepID=A0A191ZFV2_9GAMM|nr:3-methyl-2-oxobutanoate hydroxymethyltransferase [Halothiobacillus diazotrophicus]ANJ66732.1 3-methyl-2-oxobutanoate hydroxymethyltransferase [Halothiobacillus diazotrophicus]